MGSLFKPRPLFILALADLHILHAFGLAPRGWVTNAGNEVKLNKAQSYLADCFDHLLDTIPKKIDGLLLMGDITEGRNVADFGIELTEVDKDWQARGAMQMLKPLADRVALAENGCRKIYAVKGTRYHERMDGVIARDLNARPRMGHYAPYWREIWANEHVLFDVAHRQGYFLRYRSTSLSREIGFKNERAGRRKQELPKMIVIVRAHTHQYGVWMEDGAICVSLPGFKIQDAFAQASVSPNRVIPDSLGAVGFKIYDEPRDGKYVDIIPYLYDHPDDPPEVM